MKLAIKPLACGGVLALTRLGLAAAGPIEDAEAAFNRGDYATAMNILRPFAERGDAVAEYDVGVMYDQGFGVSQNEIEAAKWYRRAGDST
jgi:TPR repeat protein